VCAGRSDLNVNRYQLRGESLLISQIVVFPMSFDLYLVNLRINLSSVG
jgi:hypothetical protein